jgi:hypothetical protein
VTDQKQAPNVDSAAKGVELVKAGDFLPGESSDWSRVILLIAIGGVVLLSVLGVIWQVIRLRNVQLAFVSKGNAGMQEALLRKLPKKNDAPVLSMWPEDEFTRPATHVQRSEALSNLPVQTVVPFEGIEDVTTENIELD